MYLDDVVAAQKLGEARDYIGLFCASVCNKANPKGLRNLGLAVMNPPAIKSINLAGIQARRQRILSRMCAGLRKKTVFRLKRSF
jgi:hypothetical protein